MARASYQAPGVYVEEVPSAQQPIAGVGTNTVAFIGVVPDEIYFPVPNEIYNPALAQAVARAKTESKKIPAVGGTPPKSPERLLEEERKAAAEDLTRTKEDRTTRFRELTEAGKVGENNIARVVSDEGVKSVLDRAPETPEGVDQGEWRRLFQFDKTRLTRAQDRLTQAETALTTLKESGGGVPPASPATSAAPSRPAATEQSALLPYSLEKFTVNINPCDTKFCTNFSEYTALFGSFSADDVDGKPLAPGHRALTHAVYGFFKNGGNKLFVTRINPTANDKPGGGNADHLKHALEAIATIDAVAIVAAPGLYDPDVWGELVAHCDNCEDRFAILDCKPEINSYDDARKMGLNDETLNTEKVEEPPRAKNAAFYIPYIEVVDPAKQLQDPALGIQQKYWGRTYVSPTGHLAGIYARVDEERGVHKAPANTPILGALNVRYYINKARQELLNPKGINCIRDMNGNITVWGARTIGGDANGEWKYISVRRFFLFLRESIDEGTQWCVFEPNDPQLWGKIRRNVSAFLTNVWRNGALFGLTPQEAFYVKCDAELNPPEIRDLGMVVTEIGVAIVRPAEFVIFRVTQSVGQKSG